MASTVTISGAQNARAARPPAKSQKRGRGPSRAQPGQQAAQAEQREVEAAREAEAAAPDDHRHDGQQREHHLHRNDLRNDE